jgi:hypothetical protein
VSECTSSETDRPDVKGDGVGRFWGRRRGEGPAYLRHKRISGRQAQEYRTEDSN